MEERVAIGGLHVSKSLHDLIRDEAAPGTGVEPARFWSSLSAIVADLGPDNRRLLERRDVLQSEIDAWHRQHRGRRIEPAEMRNFLSRIGYLVAEGPDFEVTTENVDPEIASVAGPQLVVPLSSARYALNAANARWGSLYNALYGTDAVPDTEGAERGPGFNPTRACRVIERTAQILDEAAPLASGSHQDVVAFRLRPGPPARLEVELADGTRTGLADAAAFAGYRGEKNAPECLLLRHHGLHIEVHLDPDHPVGRLHRAGVKDVVLEAAITTIADCEDAVAAVDAEDKTLVYRNWLGIMRGTLEARLDKGGEELTRRLAPDRPYTAPDGKPLTLSGRSLLLVRSVGAHMYTDAVTLPDGESIPETFLDAMVTSLAAMHDLRRNGNFVNSRTGSIYIVRPKMHGPEEAAAAVALFARVEQALGLEPNTLKIGIMDEERRTTVNLKECIRAARERVVFINTGFLDRTGDEIHTMMECGAVIPKAEMKGAAWIRAYEDWNVDVGLEAGLRGRAQIGKGMWPAPDAMAAMLETKVGHPRAGANTAWVPSPTAATLHAVHYHQVDVAKRQRQIATRGRACLEDILTLPLLGPRNLSAEEVDNELDNNAQSILGYVVRWVGQGVGCSKVPDINDVALMEDRATLRISSQHVANWLRHGLLDETRVRASFEKMARVVDRQNAGDPAYRAMAPDFESSIEFNAALDLVFEGRKSPNGYTEGVLHARRREAKSGRAN